MADINVDDLVRSIRQQARESAAQEPDPSDSASGSFARPLARLQTSLAIIRRAQDQLPPVTTYRGGLAARLELWIKRQLKRVTHWYTWEQVNFNSSVDRALNSTLAILQNNEERLSSLQIEVAAGLVSKANLESQLTELEERLSLVENRFDALLAEKLLEMRIEHQKAIELLVEEQRLCYKQLTLEISEAGVITDRTKRSIQLRVDELGARLEKLNAEHDFKEAEKKDPRTHTKSHERV